MPYVGEKKHVALTRCFFCGEPDRILLAKTYRQNGEPLHDLAPLHDKVVDMESCKKCEDLMKQGVILLSFDPHLSEKGWEKERLPNPYRTGHFVVIKLEALNRFFGDKNPSAAAFTAEHRWIFVEQEVVSRLLREYEESTKTPVTEKPDNADSQ